MTAPSTDNDRIEDDRTPHHEPNYETQLYYESNLNKPSWLEVCVAEEMNPSRRCHMEDCSVVHLPGTWNATDPGLAYLGVYDGHGGRDVVTFLKHTMARIVALELARSDNTAQCLSQAFLMADIRARCQLKETRAGATVAICLIKQLGDRIRIVAANAGDARIVLGHNGSATRLTCDHKADNDDEVERVREAGGFCFKGRVSGVLAVTRSLGDFYLKDFVIAEPYVSEETIQLPPPKQQQQQQPSFVVLACDGLWDVMTDQEVVDFVGSFEGEWNQVSRQLIKEAIRRGSADNITAVVAILSL